MKTTAANFDRLARGYRLLEFVAFGRDLERARFALLDRLAARRSILVLGEGDGRCLARLVRAAPFARIHCLDASAAMLARAGARIAGTPAAGRVRFEQADLRTFAFAPGSYDAVVTMFFLDCFRTDEAARIVKAVDDALQPAATWLYADFALPAKGPARLRARAWLAVLYGFFRLGTGLHARELPPAEDLIRRTGFVPEAERTLQAGLLRSVAFLRQEAETGHCSLSGNPITRA